MSTNVSKSLDVLIDVRDQLYGIINDASKAQEVRVAALEEHEEVALRVRTLLARDLEVLVDSLKPLADNVIAAKGEVKQVLGAAAKSADVVKGVTKFLSVVDKLADKAKMLLPLL